MPQLHRAVARRPKFRRRGDKSLQDGLGQMTALGKTRQGEKRCRRAALQMDCEQKIFVCLSALLA